MSPRRRLFKFFKNFLNRLYSKKTGNFQSFQDRREKFKFLRRIGRRFWKFKKSKFFGKFPENTGRKPGKPVSFGTGTSCPDWDTCPDFPVSRITAESRLRKPRNTMGINCPPATFITIANYVSKFAQPISRQPQNSWGNVFKFNPKPTETNRFLIANQMTLFPHRAISRLIEEKG